MFPTVTHGAPKGDPADYKREVFRLREKYRDQIKIFYGLEADFYAGVPLEGYDYLIGAVHALKIGEAYVGFDRTADRVREIIDGYFDGDGLAFAEEYYRTLARLPEAGPFDIIAHFDLITKNLEKADLFDPKDPRYLKAAISAAECLAGKIPYFEVNTGAIARGYRTTPYPAPELIGVLRELGFGAIITSDCHDRRMLDCRFEEARQLLWRCGYTERYILTDEGFRSVAL